MRNKWNSNVFVISFVGLHYVQRSRSSYVTLMHRSQFLAEVCDIGGWAQVWRRCNFGGGDILMEERRFKKYRLVHRNQNGSNIVTRNGWFYSKGHIYLSYPQLSNVSPHPFLNISRDSKCAIMNKVILQKIKPWKCSFLTFTLWRPLAAINTVSYFETEFYAQKLKKGWNNVQFYNKLKNKPSLWRQILYHRFY